MQVTFHGLLAEQYGKDHFIHASSIKDALEGLSRQLKIFENIMVDRRPVMRIVGHLTEESLSENPDKIDVIPMVGGGGGFTKIVIGSIIIAAAILIPGAQFLLPVGISMVLGGVMELFIKAPSLSKQSDPEASTYLGLGNNTTKLGTLRSYSMGTVKVVTPHVIAINVDSNDLVKGEFPA